MFVFMSLGTGAPSVLLMLAIPALVAQVESNSGDTAQSEGNLDDGVLAACKVAGLKKFTRWVVSRL